MFYEGVSEDVLNPKQTEVQTQQQNIKGKGKLLSCVRLFATPRAILQARILEWSKEHPCRHAIIKLQKKKNQR